jgi:Glutathione S-transferase, N-terminal domain
VNLEFHAICNTVQCFTQTQRASCGYPVSFEFDDLCSCIPDLPCCPAQRYRKTFNLEDGQTLFHAIVRELLQSSAPSRSYQGFISACRSKEYTDGEHRLTKTEEFRRKNPTGRVPLVELENGEFISESNAILHYFAEGTPFLPAEKIERARVYQWMFFEQNTHEAGIAVRMATFSIPTVR